MEKYEPFKIGKRNLNENDHWQEVDYMTIDKPTVICLGGNGTISPKDANAVCKVAQNLLGLKEKTRENQIATNEDVNIYGISYGKEEEKDNISTLKDEELDEIVDRTFKPLFVDENNKPLTEEQMLKNFNKITFFVHCHGATILNELTIKVVQEMRNLGLPDETIDKVFDQSTAVSYAPIRRIFLPNVQVVSARDSTLFTGPINAKITNEYIVGAVIENDYEKCKGVVSFTENENTVTLLASRLRKNGDEHSLDIVERDENWKLSYKEKIIKQLIEQNEATNEQAIELTRFLDRNDDLSQATSIALSEYVGNSVRNYYNELNDENADFIPKPNSETLVKDMKEALGDSFNLKFEETINLIKNDFENEPSQN